ncbi:Hypothetical protein A7982_06924 [Minicystis rosea]|nr:Hypothetical protein A7982_06924 [Minicystis rosea]
MGAKARSAPGSSARAGPWPLGKMSRHSRIDVAGRRDHRSVTAAPPIAARAVVTTPRSRSQAGAENRSHSEAPL